MGDDFFSLAQLEQPTMMPNAPSGGGALAGLMYGQDKARQDRALEGANGLAQLNAMLQQQHASEDMAGAPGRMDTIKRGNLMAAGGLANAPTDVDTGAATSRNANVKAHLEALAPYAMNYRDTMSQGDFSDLRDRMKGGGISKIGNKNLDDVSDEQLEKVLKDTKNYFVNNPKHLQEMDKQQLVNEGWDQRYTTQGNSRENVANINQTANITRQQMRDKAKIEATKIMADVQAGKLNPGQYKTMLMEKIRGGDLYSELVLNHIEAMELARPAAISINSGPHLEVGKDGADLAPPAVPKPPPFPRPTSVPGGAPAAPGAASKDQLPTAKFDSDGTTTVGGKKLKGMYRFKADPSVVVLEDGSRVREQ
jgi:hypothetical protein